MEQEERTLTWNRSTVIKNEGVLVGEVTTEVTNQGVCFFQACPGSSLLSPVHDNGHRAL